MKDGVARYVLSVEHTAKAWLLNSNGGNGWAWCEHAGATAVVVLRCVCMMGDRNRDSPDCEPHSRQRSCCSARLAA